MPCNKFSYVIYKGILTDLYNRILILYVISDLKKYVNFYLFTNFKVFFAILFTIQFLCLKIPCHSPTSHCFDPTPFIVLYIT